jgi:hypothetical protein
MREPLKIKGFENDGSLIEEQMNSVAAEMTTPFGHLSHGGQCAKAAIGAQSEKGRMSSIFCRPPPARQPNRNGKEWQNYREKHPVSAF